MSTANGSTNSQALAPTTESKKPNKPSKLKASSKGCLPNLEETICTHKHFQCYGTVPKTAQKKFFYYGETINWINPLQNQLQRKMNRLIPGCTGHILLPNHSDSLGSLLF